MSVQSGYIEGKQHNAPRAWSFGALSAIAGGAIGAAVASPATLAGSGNSNFSQFTLPAAAKIAKIVAAVFGSPSGTSVDGTEIAAFVLPPDVYADMSNGDPACPATPYAIGPTDNTGELGYPTAFPTVLTGLTAQPVTLDVGDVDHATAVIVPDIPDTVYPAGSVILFYAASPNDNTTDTYLNFSALVQYIDTKPYVNSADPSEF